MFNVGQELELGVLEDIRETDIEIGSVTVLKAGQLTVSVKILKFDPESKKITGQVVSVGGLN